MEDGAGSVAPGTELTSRVEAHEGSPFLSPGDTCQGLYRADRVAFLIDGDAYFDALRKAFSSATRSILILGWDLHSKVDLGSREDGTKNELPFAACLDALTRERKELAVHVLVWNPAPIYAFEREPFPWLSFGLRTGAQVRVALASDHPLGASHHQKVVVVDDAIAFVGGIDLTEERWDTRDHAPSETRRRDHRNRPYPPFHDLMVAVDSDAARALGDFARSRWLEVEGEELEPVAPGSEPWPPALEPDLRDVDVALSFTRGAQRDQGPRREIERLHLRSIEEAKHWIYYEQCYLTADSIVDALASRLRGMDGPEILFITPLHQSGALEQRTLGALRARNVDRLRREDAHDRLRVLCPVLEDGRALNVHSKLTIVDDRFVHIGSANLTNRSMSLDSECDLAIDVRDDAEGRAAIARLRRDLLAEHLNDGPEEIAEREEAEGSILRAVALVNDDGPLVPLPVDVDKVTETLEHLIDQGLIADPPGPLDEALAERTLPSPMRESGAGRVTRAVFGAILLLSLLGLGLFADSRGYVDAESLAAWVEPLRSSPAGAPIAIAAFTVAVIAMVPITAVVVGSVLLFGPFVGAGISLLVSALAGAVGYGLGKVLWEPLLTKLPSDRLRSLRERLIGGGIYTVLAVRLIPVAPFTMANMVVGSAGIRFHHFLIGTLLGMCPGILAMAFASDRIVAAIRDPSAATIAIAVGVVIAMAILVVGARRIFRRFRNEGAELEGAGGR